MGGVPNDRTGKNQRKSSNAVSLAGREVYMFMQEMRDRDNQRAEDMREIRSSIDSMGKHVRNLALTAMGAIGAMVVTVIISLLKS